MPKKAHVALDSYLPHSTIVLLRFENPQGGIHYMVKNVDNACTASFDLTNFHFFPAIRFEAQNLQGIKNCVYCILFTAKEFCKEHTTRPYADGQHTIFSRSIISCCLRIAVS